MPTLAIKTKPLKTHESKAFPHAYNLILTLDELLKLKDLKLDLQNQKLHKHKHTKHNLNHMMNEHNQHMHELSFTNSSSSISQAQTNSEAYLKARVWAGKQGKAHGATKKKGNRHSHTHSLTLTQTKENRIKER